MACEYICDGCGKRQKAAWYPTNPHNLFKPIEWFERGDDRLGIQHACSRECVKKVAEKTGSTDIVAPF